MNTQMKERMDGLVTISLKDQVKEYSNLIIRELKREGFEDIDIIEYLEELVKESGQ